MVYLIHFDRPLKHAQHYIGYCANGKLKKRIERHMANNGSRLIRAVNLAGIKWSVVRTWTKADRTFERKLKNRKRASSLCPVCKQLHA